MNQQLNIKKLVSSAKLFCKEESIYANKDLFGVTDGKAVGTYVEHKFQALLESKYKYERGSSARGIDLPGKAINTDIKVTFIKQPQSSCPYRDAKQKIFGLGYNLLLFVYDKTDNTKTKTTQLNFVNCTFITKERTADYTTTFRLREMVNDGANEEDIMAFLSDRNIPADEMTLKLIAQNVLQSPPLQGYLTVSNALQWRLQYGRIVRLSEKISGITNIIQS